MRVPDLTSACAGILSYLDACMVKGVLPDGAGTRLAAGGACDRLYSCALDELDSKGYAAGILFAETAAGYRFAVMDDARPTIEGERWLRSIGSERELPDPMTISIIVDSTACRRL